VSSTAVAGGACCANPDENRAEAWCADWEVRDGEALLDDEKPRRG
jgi:hypothetical protein